MSNQQFPQTETATSPLVQKLSRAIPLNVIENSDVIIYRGQFPGQAGELERQLTPRYFLIEAWCSGQREIWVNHREDSIVVYADGVVSVECYRTPDGYMVGLQEKDDLYGRKK